MNEHFGPALREWRQQRRLSQMDLGLGANVSARHISFLETGRASPSRSMVLQLCEELEVPRVARNRLLTAAGLAPAYAERSLTEEQMQPVRSAVDWMMQRHDPYPAFAMDRLWRVRKMNGTAGMLLSGMGLQIGESMLAALAGNQLLQAAIENFDEVLNHTILRVRTELAHLGGDAELEEALANLTELQGDKTQDPGGVMPAFIPTRYRAGGMALSMFSTFTQFGTAEDIALSELRIEMLFPADDLTREFLEGLAASATETSA